MKDYLLKSFWALVLCLPFLAVTAGCQTIYYETMEKFGVHKRDILVDRVEEARDSQKEAKEQFTSALEQFRATVNVRGGELEKVYIKLNKELESSEARAQEVHERIDAVENVAKALFKEWEKELEQYTSAGLRASSEQKLLLTKRRYGELMEAMRRAEARIAPVLNPLRDQVLYLKHNLNARAILALQDELDIIETDIGALIRDMEASINEADSFIAAITRE